MKFYPSLRTRPSLAALTVEMKNFPPSACSAVKSQKTMKAFSILDAKARLRVPALWRHFGFSHEPGKSCCCPWRDDSNASFSVSSDGRIWHDFATAEGGDAVDFLQRATGLNKAAACRKFVELAAVSMASSLATPTRLNTPAPKAKPTFPPMESVRNDDMRRLSALRNIARGGLWLAHRRGLLRFATLREHRVWIVTDPERLNAQARRLDGGRWEHLDGQPKAWTLPGSWGAWSVGAKAARDFSTVALCEGGPDLLAAFHFIDCERRAADCAAVAVLGASNPIHRDALPCFAGKRVRIFGHDDEAGRAAVDRWAREIEGVGADVDAFDFSGLTKTDGSPVTDLNDLTTINPDDFEKDRQVWNLLP